METRHHAVSRLPHHHHNSPSFIRGQRDVPALEAQGASNTGFVDELAVVSEEVVCLQVRHVGRQVGRQYVFKRGLERRAALWDVEPAERHNLRQRIGVRHVSARLREHACARGWGVYERHQHGLEIVCAVSGCARGDEQRKRRAVEGAHSSIACCLFGHVLRSLYLFSGHAPSKGWHQKQLPLKRASFRPGLRDLAGLGTHFCDKQ